MQTYTHAAGGWVLAQILFPGQYGKQTALIVGSCLPDTYTAALFMWDKLNKRTPFAEMPPHIVRNINITHSLLVWLITLVYTPLFIGCYSHLAADVASHRDARFRETDPTFLWPLRWRIPGLFDYRDRAGNLFTPVDMVVTSILLVIGFILACGG